MRQLSTCQSRNRANYELLKGAIASLIMPACLSSFDWLRMTQGKYSALVLVLVWVAYEFWVG